MKYNVVNVLDTELTCYENDVFPPGETREIIEFGLTEVDLKAQKIIRTLSIPVVPTMSQVSRYCTDLTGWTYARLARQGVTYPEACRRLSEKYGARNRLLVVDSSRETEPIRAQCQLMGVECPFGPNELNVSHMFGLLTGQTRRHGLERMLGLLGLEFEGTPHRAGDDSRNIARILLAIINRGAIMLPS